MTNCCRTLKLTTRRNGAATLYAELFCDKLFFENGCRVRLTESGKTIFVGYIFELRRNDAGVITLTVHDQLRYLKAKDTLNLTNVTLSGFVRQLAASFRLKTGVIEESGSVVSSEILSGCTLLDMLCKKIAETAALNGKQFVLYDEGGLLCLRDEQSLKTGITISDGTICTGYSVRQSIEDSCNRIIMICQGKNIGVVRLHEAEAADSMNKYGVLQDIRQVNQNTDSATLAAMSHELLARSCGEQQQITLAVLGDFALLAGRVITVEQSGLERAEYRILRAVHQVGESLHTTELEVERIAG